MFPPLPCSLHSVQRYPLVPSCVTRAHLRYPRDAIHRSLTTYLPPSRLPCASPHRAAVVTTHLLPSGCSSLFSPTLAEARAPLTRPPHRSYGGPTLSARLTCVSSPTRSCHLLPAPCLLGPSLVSLSPSTTFLCFPRHYVPPTRSGTSLPSCRW